MIPRLFDEHDIVITGNCGRDIAVGGTSIQRTVVATPEQVEEKHETDTATEYEPGLPAQAVEHSRAREHREHGCDGITRHLEGALEVGFADPQDDDADRHR